MLPRSNGDADLAMAPRRDDGALAGDGAGHAKEADPDADRRRDRRDDGVGSRAWAAEGGGGQPLAVGNRWPLLAESVGRETFRQQRRAGPAHRTAARELMRRRARVLLPQLRGTFGSSAVAGVEESPRGQFPPLGPGAIAVAGPRVRLSEGAAAGAGRTL